MNDSNVITSEDGRIASALHALKRCAKEVDKLTDGFHPPLGGERYMTDKEVIARLKVSRRTLQEYRTDRKIPYIVFGGKSSLSGIRHRKDARGKLPQGNPLKTKTGRCRSLPVSLFVRFNSEVHPYTE